MLGYCIHILKYISIERTALGIADNGAKSSVIATQSFITNVGIIAKNRVTKTIYIHECI